MESFKEKIPMIIAVIIVIALIVGAYYILVIHKDLYRGSSKWTAWKGKSRDECRVGLEKLHSKLWIQNRD